MEAETFLEELSDEDAVEKLVRYLNKFTPNIIQGCADISSEGTKEVFLQLRRELKKQGKTLSEKISEIAKYQNSGEINFRLEDKSGAMKALCEHYTKQETALKTMDFDGFRLEFEDWWFNIRPSNTEPYLRFICEARTKELLDEKIEETQRLLESEFGAIRS